MAGNSRSGMRSKLPTSPGSIPDCPKGLTNAEREVWDETIREMTARGTLREVHVPVIHALAATVAEYRECARLIAKQGILIERKFGNGARRMIRNPLLEVRDAAVSRMRALYRDLGLSAFVRGRMTVQPDRLLMAGWGGASALDSFRQSKDDEAESA